MVVGQACAVQPGVPFRPPRELSSFAQPFGSPGRSLVKSTFAVLLVGMDRPIERSPDLTEHPNVERVRDAYEAVANLDVDGASRISPSMPSSTSPARVRSAGITRGPSIAAALIGTFELTGGTQKLEISGIFADDRHAVVVVYETASRPDGATLDVDEVHLLALDADGRVTDLWDLPNDPEAHDPFFDGL